MKTKSKGSEFNELIERTEKLPLEDQALLVDILYQRLSEKRRDQLAKDIGEARKAYRKGKVRRGTADELLEEVSS